jgi:HSP20 family molecular chaperone IbpA
MTDAPGRKGLADTEGLKVDVLADLRDDAPALLAIDLFTDDESVTVTAETRNATAENVHVTLAEDKLFIGLGEGPNAFRKDVTINVPVDEEKSVATFRNGVLDIVLPRRKPKA